MFRTVASVSYPVANVPDGCWGVLGVARGVPSGFYSVMGDHPDVLAGCKCVVGGLYRAVGGNQGTRVGV